MVFPDPSSVEPQDRETFGRWLRQQREATGVTQGRLAELAVVQVSTSSHVEHDRGSMPSVGTLLAWADAFEIDHDDDDHARRQASPDLAELLLDLDVVRGVRARMRGDGAPGSTR